jgi:hypothetical protein
MNYYLFYPLNTENKKTLLNDADNFSYCCYLFFGPHIYKKLKNKKRKYKKNWKNGRRK